MKMPLEDGAPAWFHEAVAQPRSAHALTSRDGTGLHMAGWNAGERDKPPLLLVHGYRGNAHWWDFIAPWFCATHRVFALDLAGMGESGSRAIYTTAAFTDDVIAAVEHLASQSPLCAVTVAAHSFGGGRLLEGCVGTRRLISHAIVLDSHIAMRGDAPFPRLQVGNPRPYADRRLAESRFRLLPDQPHLGHLKSYLASQSLREVDGGWTWQFDPALPLDLIGLPMEDYAPAVDVPVDLVRGEHSVLLDAARARRIAAMLPRCRSLIELPAAHHHLMLDQPLALVATMRCLLACPPR